MWVCGCVCVEIYACCIVYTLMYIPHAHPRPHSHTHAHTHLCNIYVNRHEYMVVMYA